MAQDPNNQSILQQAVKPLQQEAPKPQESKYHSGMPHPVGTILVDRFKILKVLGKGSFGVVYQVRDDVTNQVLALKAFKRKFPSWESAMRNAEVKAMIGLKHANIVSCSEVLLHDSMLMIIFELLDMDLYRMMQMRKLNDDPFSHEEIRHIIKQIAIALDYIHQHGFFHRDVKPENVLVQNQTTIKLGDFGLVKEIRHPTPFTEYVSTRWYRAPENVLGSRSYNYPVDIFALGCIMAELYTFKPLFPGASEMDQFEKISRIMGKPLHDDWPDAKRLADRKMFNMPVHNKVPLQQVVPRASPEAISLMEWMLQYNPKKRPKPHQVFQHEFFQPKIITTGNKSSLLGTTAESTTHGQPKSNQSRVESLVLGSNSIKLKSKLLDSNVANKLGGGSDQNTFQSQLSMQNTLKNHDASSPSNQAAIAANGKQGRNMNMRNSIEATKLEPIDEQQKGNRQPSQNGESVANNNNQNKEGGKHMGEVDLGHGHDEAHHRSPPVNNANQQQNNAQGRNNSIKFSQTYGKGKDAIAAQAHAAHMNRTLNSRRFKQQISNSSSKALPGAPNGIALDSVNRSIDFSNQQQQVQHGNQKSLNHPRDQRNLSMIQTKRTLNHTTIDHHAAHNKTTNQNWLPKVGNVGSGAGSNANTPSQNSIVTKFKNGNLSPQPLNLQNQTMTHKFMQAQSLSHQKPHHANVNRNRNANVTDDTGRSPNVQISHYNQIGGGVGANGQQQYLNAPIGQMQIAGAPPQGGMNSTLSSTNQNNGNGQDQLKLQLPEIMQQQQAKIGQIKKAHHERFANGAGGNNIANVANSTKSNKFNSTFNNPGGMGATLRDPQLRSLDEAAVTDRTDAAKRNAKGRLQ